MSDAQTEAKPPKQAPRAGRRVGYVVAIVINAVLLYVINDRPGWQAWEVLTADFVTVLWIINLSLSLSLIANTLYCINDAPWFKAMSELVLAIVNLVVAVRLYQVFPFDFTSVAFGWTVLARLVLVIAMIGSSIAIIAWCVALIRGARSPG